MQDKDKDEKDTNIPSVGYVRTLDTRDFLLMRINPIYLFVHSGTSY